MRKEKTGASFSRRVRQLRRIRPSVRQKKGFEHLEREASGQGWRLRDCRTASVKRG